MLIGYSPLPFIVAGPRHATSALSTAVRLRPTVEPNTAPANSTSPDLRAAVIDMAYPGASGSDHCFWPVAGWRPTTASPSQMTNCPVPFTSMRVGGAYPISFADSAFHTSLPAALSHATTVLPSPPTVVMSVPL